MEEQDEEEEQYLALFADLINGLPLSDLGMISCLTEQNLSILWVTATERRQKKVSGLIYCF